MKLLLDQNISFRIVKKLSRLFPNSNHVKTIGLVDSSDIEIFNLAKTNGYTILTFDADFLDISLIKGSPPKLIWLNTGNFISGRLIKELSIDETRSVKFDLSNSEGVHFIYIMNRDGSSEVHRVIVIK